MLTVNVLPRGTTPGLIVKSPHRDTTGGGSVHMVVVVVLLDVVVVVVHPDATACAVPNFVALVSTTVTAIASVTSVAAVRWYVAVWLGVEKSSGGLPPVRCPPWAVFVH